MPCAKPRLALAATAILVSVTTAHAVTLNPSIGQSLNRLLVFATQSCQNGNAEACVIGQQLNALGNRLFDVEVDCQAGNRNACDELDSIAEQLHAEVDAMMRNRLQPPAASASSAPVAAERATVSWWRALAQR